MKLVYVIKDVEVKGLFDLKDLCAQAKREDHCKLSPETNIFMLKLLIEELGSSLVQKLCRKRRYCVFSTVYLYIFLSRIYRVKLC